MPSYKEMMEQRRKQIDEASGWSDSEAPAPAPKPKKDEGYKDPILEQANKQPGTKRKY
jgi:hypothetical protein